MTMKWNFMIARNYNMTCYDDDGGHLINEKGQLILFDPECKHEAVTAVFLSAWAGSDREIHGLLQASYKGRNQKAVRMPQPAG